MKVYEMPELQIEEITVPENICEGGGGPWETSMV